MNRNKTKTIVLVAIFAAIFYLLSKYGTIKISSSIKFTFQNLPLYVSGILFGDIISATIGTIGMLLSQIYSEYGVTVTTVLWILPYTVAGFLSGRLYAMFKDKLVNPVYMFLYLAFINLCITFLNTIAQIIDALIFGYYSEQLIFGSIFIRILNALLISVLYTIIVPLIVKALKRINYFN